MATVKELRAQAKAAGIKGYSGMKKAELESALSIQTTTEKTSEKAEHLLRSSYWEQKTLLNEEYSLYDILRLLAEYGVRNSLYEYECKQYFIRTGKKAKADFILKHMLLDWLHKRAEVHEKVSEPISAERTEEATEALKTAESESEIKSILEGCSQEQLHEVYLEYTGRSDEIAPLDWSKEETVRYYTVMLSWYKEDEKRKRELAENMRAAEEESENEVQKVMDAITAVNYEPKATREILKAQTENFRYSALQIFYVGLGGFWNKGLREKALIDGFIVIKETGKRQEYLKNTATWLRIGQSNIEYCRENEEFRQHLPEFEERQRYYQEWQEYLESYEGKKELSA